MDLVARPALFLKATAVEQRRSDPLLEHEAQRIAEALDDYENVSVADIGGSDGSGLWLVVHDHRFNRRCEISSHCDYWEFVFRHAVGRPAGAVTLAATAKRQAVAS